MVDPFLLAMAFTMESNPNSQQALTLFFNGAIVSGRLVSEEEFFEQLPDGARMMEAIRSAAAQSDSKRGDNGRVLEPSGKLLHLLGVRWHHPNLPSFVGTGAALRVNLDHVAAVMLGVPEEAAK